MAVAIWVAVFLALEHVPLRVVPLPHVPVVEVSHDSGILPMGWTLKGKKGVITTLSWCFCGAIGVWQY